MGDQEMIAPLATTYSIEQPKLVQPTLQVAQLAASVRPSDTPWLYSALTQVWQIEHSGENLPGVGDFRISEVAATRARIILSMIDLVELPPPHVAPVSGGGMSIAWTIGPKEVKYSVYPDGVAMYFQVQDDEVSNDGTLTTMMPTEVSEPLKWMLDAR
jgi:hypothetical protein